MHLLDSLDRKALQSRIRKNSPTGEKHLVIFRRQYLQRIPLLQFKWPCSELLRDYEVQMWIYENLKNFNLVNHQSDSQDVVSRWQRDIWAELMKRIELAVQESEEPDIFDQLMEHCALLQQTPVLPYTDEVQQDVWITYEFGNIDMLDTTGTIKLLERPRVLSGSSCTGYRTWEAALGFGMELVTSWLPSLKFKDKKVLELGSGPGLLSFLCVSSPSYAAARVVATDGDDEVVQRFRENKRILAQKSPDLAHRLNSETYKWGEPFEGTIVGEEISLQAFDYCLAADVMYDPRSISSLVWTIVELFKHNKHLKCVLSATLRNPETFDKFLQEFQDRELKATISRPLNDSEQSCLFHTDGESIRFIHVEPA